MSCAIIITRLGHLLYQDKRFGKGLCRLLAHISEIDLGVYRDEDLVLCSRRELDRRRDRIVGVYDLKGIMISLERL